MRQRSGHDPNTIGRSRIRSGSQQIVEAFPWDTAPRYLVRDNDAAYGQAFTNPPPSDAWLPRTTTVVVGHGSRQETQTGIRTSGSEPHRDQSP
jgi:hypothetical protein